jgi:hypothetical protein
MTDTIDKRVLMLHEAICRCPKCKGSCEKIKLCRRCLQLDKMINNLPPLSIIEKFIKQS